MRQGQPALGVISDVGIPSLFIEKASLPTQRSGRCSSVVELGTCHLRPRFNSWLRADFCVFLITASVSLFESWCWRYVEVCGEVEVEDVLFEYIERQ